MSDEEKNRIVGTAAYISPEEVMDLQGRVMKLRDNLRAAGMD